jgi:hypothetical protein
MDGNLGPRAGPEGAASKTGSTTFTTYRWSPGLRASEQAAPNASRERSDRSPANRMRWKFDVVALPASTGAVFRAFVAAEGNLASLSQVKLHQMANPRNTSPTMIQRTVLTTRR